MIKPVNWNRKFAKKAEYPIANQNTLEQRAIRENWGIPQESMKAIMERQVEIATSKESACSAATKAAGICLKMVAQDRQGDATSDQSINIGGSVVIGTDALSTAIRDRMARRTAIECAETDPEGCGNGSEPLEP